MNTIGQYAIAQPGIGFSFLIQRDRSTPDKCENWYQIIICEKLVSKLTRAKNWYQILTDVKIGTKLSHM